ncbi:MAG: discoidin domain-containing protein, partial [Planctomycetota bacterium]
MKSKIVMLVFVLALGGVAQAQGTYIVLAEDFEGLILGPRVEEELAGDGVWTDTPPAGWTIDESGVPGVGNPATDGVTEWAGWAFTNKEWWTQTAGDQRRSEFVLGQGTVAVADPDEWDDSGHPGPISADPYDTWLSTPAIDISASKPGSAQLQFDSSWRPEFDSDYHQTGNLTVSFDGADPIELFRWESDSTSTNFKDDNSTNETIVVNLDNPPGATSMVITFGLFDAGNDWWWAIDNIIVTAERSAELAHNPNPPNRAVEVPWKPVLSWTPGQYVVGLSPKHKVILSDNFDNVNNGTAVVATQDPNSYDAAGLLDFSTTYYWRIDEANSTTGWDQGNVWQFTTEHIAYPIAGENITATASSANQADMGPENTINGSGLDDNDLHSNEETDMWLSSAEPLGAWIEYEFDKIHKLYQMWVWNSNQTVEPLVGFGLKDVTIEYSTNGTDYTTLGTTHEFARAPGAAGYAYNTTIDFGGVAAKYVRLTATSNWGGIMPQYGLSEVRFLHIPVHARAPYPDSGATGVPLDVVLGWRAGREAVTHDVYFSTDEQAVIDRTASVATVTEARHGPLSLDLDVTYYWRVDEVNEAETPNTWESNIWSFTVADHVVVDDFESYNDLDPADPASKRIFNVWMDGYEVPTNGSLVGYENPPFCERSIVHGGKQSMPFFYANTGGAANSEAELTLSPPQDWTAGSAKVLSLWFFGDASNTAAQMYVKVNSTKVAYDGNAGNLVLPSWQVWNIDLASVGTGLQSVTKLAIGVDGNGASGTLYFDDIGLYVLAPAPVNEWRIADDSDDAEENLAAGGIDLGSSDLELPYENTGQGNPQIIGVRFAGIPIPKGATITEAWVRFQVDETKGGTEPVNLIIEGQLSPNPATFSSTVGDISSRPRTTVQVQWSVPNWTTAGD